MASVDRDALRSFLLGNDASETLVAEAMEHLEHFFVAAEDGKYPLKPVGEIDLEVVKAAISRSTGQEVEKVVPISQAQPFPRPEWMSEGVHGAILDDRLEDSLGDSIERDSLEEGFESSFGDGLRDKLESGLRDRLGDIIWPSIEDGVRESLKNILWTGLEGHFGGSFWANLVYALELVLAGEEEQAQTLFSLLDAWDGILILGEKEDESGVWIILVA